MGRVLLSDVLESWELYELDDSIYVSEGVELSLTSEVSIMPFDRTRKRIVGDQCYLLGIEQIRDVVEGLKAQLGRTTTLVERLRAVVHFTRYDAFINPRDAVGN
ncbi:hypothetical protein BH09MYX1_BH09MYX1_67410 [soil metagenome]